MSAPKESPIVYLAIEKGTFSAPAHDGPGRGRYSVVLAGWDPEREYVDDDGVTHSVPLFEDYRFEVDFPVPNHILEVTVPESQAKARTRK
ncbi:MAG: hypothetical protein NZ899_06030 [Thermoguttaceae bacterium]|nr:hypothetical protein [Thermoguttaceae bacterium]MDW8079497.1 hypothetical protein [Thermoguttaceae bacterium]